VTATVPFTGFPYVYLKHISKSQTTHHLQGLGFWRALKAKDSAKIYLPGLKYG